jgi:cytochrome oxidase Cu insertion factor (SCO1/SenC/PrrC family)
MADYQEYQISEADIDKTIAYLKTIDPERATPEDAIAYLEYYQAKFHALGHVLTDEELQQLYDEFASQRSKGE